MGDLSRKNVMNHLKLVAPTSICDAVIQLPASKSISNRVLIIQALVENKFEIYNLSTANDTVLLQKLLAEHQEYAFCGDGGTTVRFLLAYKALKNHKIVIDGSKRLRERPLKPLLNALKELGVDFRFQDKPDHLPLQIIKGLINGGTLDVDSSISSQFASALMLIAPYLRGGLIIKMSDKTVSSSYLKMTALIMEYFGVEVKIENDRISISENIYKEFNFTVNADWSSAAFIYGICSCLKGSSFYLKGLLINGMQGDEILFDWMKMFGIKSKVYDEGIYIEQFEVESEFVHLDLLNNPDLLPALATIAAIKGINAEFTGLQTLVHKESDRLQSVKAELEKLGVDINITSDKMVVNGKINNDLIEDMLFETYNDHRLAMAWSILSCSGKTVTINNPKVVQKSFPNFFETLKEIGFLVS